MGVETSQNINLPINIHQIKQPSLYGLRVSKYHEFDIYNIKGKELKTHF